MDDYIVVNKEQTIFVPKMAVDVFLPEFVQHLDFFLSEEEKENRPQRRDSAYFVLKEKGTKDAGQWVATLLVVPSLVDTLGENARPIGLSAFTKYYSKNWGFEDKTNYRKGYEAVLRLLRTFMDLPDTPWYETETTRPVKGLVEEQTNIVMTEHGAERFKLLGIREADEAYSTPVPPSMEPIIYTSTPWLQSTGEDHLKLQQIEAEIRLTSQATAASSVGFVIPSSIANVYLDWFEVGELPEHLKFRGARFTHPKEHSKVTGIRRMEELRRETISNVQGQYTYYPVGYDRKARQYMAGYPINPQGAKSDRPLFYVVSNALPKEKMLADLTMMGKDIFGEDWPIMSNLTVAELEDHNNDFIKQVCTTKGELDLEKYTVLLEYAKQKEKL